MMIYIWYDSSILCYKYRKLVDYDDIYDTGLVYFKQPNNKNTQNTRYFRNLLGWMDTHLESSQVDSMHPKKTPFEK